MSKQKPDLLDDPGAKVPPTRDQPIERPSPVAEKKKPRATDPTLLVAAKLDRLLGELPPVTRSWALAWLQAKYADEAAKEVQP